MKILVSTTQSQGQRNNDFCFLPDGEWVRLGTVCDRDKRDPDGGCGCGRSMTGLKTGKGTTTFVVADLPVSEADYLKQYRECDIAAGWGDIMPEEETHAEAKQMLNVAASFPVGAVLERRLDVIRVRRILKTVPAKRTGRWLQCSLF